MPRTAPKNTSPLRDRVAALSINASPIPISIRPSVVVWVKPRTCYHRCGHRTIEAAANDGNEAGNEDHETGDAGDDCVGSETRCVGGANLPCGHRCRCDILLDDRCCLNDLTSGRGFDHGRDRLDDNIAALVEGHLR